MLFVQCIQPHFVGHVKSLSDEIPILMSKLPKLAGTWNGNMNHKNEGNGHFIEKGTIFKYPEELLMLCELYWNDFFCGHYQDQIPQICLDENEQEWHQPDYCIDLNNEQMVWPDHRHGSS